MRIAAALALAALTAGCNLTNDTVLVAMLVQSPAPPAGLGVTAPQTTAAQVYLGRTSVTSPSAGDVKPLSGATVRLLRDGTEIATLSEVQPGLYEATGDTFYQAGSTFRFTAQVGSDQYWGEVQGAPAAPAMTLTGTQTADIYTYPSYGNDLPAPTFPIQRACASPICDAAFYGVWSVSGTTVSATPNCTNAPQDAVALLQFAFLDDTAWRVQTFAPSTGTCFPNPPGVGDYLVGLAALKKGTTSGNTSIASAAYAGTSDAAGVIVSGP